MPPEPASASSSKRPATILPITASVRGRLLRQEDRDRFVIHGRAPGANVVAAIAEAAERSVVVRAGVVARADDRHRAVRNRITADTRVAGLVGRQAEEARLVPDEQVAVVRRLPIGEADE